MVNVRFFLLASAVFCDTLAMWFRTAEKRENQNIDKQTLQLQRKSIGSYLKR